MFGFCVKMVLNVNVLEWKSSKSLRKKVGFYILWIWVEEELLNQQLDILNFEYVIGARTVLYAKHRTSMKPREEMFERKKLLIPLNKKMELIHRNTSSFSSFSFRPKHATSLVLVAAVHVLTFEMLSKKGGKKAEKINGQNPIISHCKIENVTIVRRKSSQEELSGEKAILYLFLCFSKNFHKL